MHNFCQFHHIIFSIYQFCIGGSPIPRNYGHQNHTHHLVLAARRYQWNSKTSCCSLTSYQQIAWLCWWIRSSWACFVVFYRRIDPSYRRAVCAPLSHRSADTVVSANIAPPRCLLELTQSIFSALPMVLRSTMSIANPCNFERFSLCVHACAVT